MKFFNVIVIWKSAVDKVAPVISAKLEGVAAADKASASLRALDLLFGGSKAGVWHVVNVVEL